MVSLSREENTEEVQKMRKILRPKQQCEKLGCSLATLHRWGQFPDFPQAIKTGPNSTGRFDDELDAYLESLKGQAISPVAPGSRHGRKPRATPKVEVAA
jgi:predicted DNA-binding transcriptional regulator AlpA